MSELRTAGSTTPLGDPMAGPAEGGLPRRPRLLFDAASRTRVRTTTETPRFPYPLPNGWFIVAGSDDLSPGELRPVRAFGRDLVAFRTSAGDARLVAAYCAHLGAHLGAGGVVEDDCLRCPFHGWRYDGASGACVGIPYGSGRIPTRARIRAYPVVERNRMVWAWFHLEGGPPFYEVPEVPEIEDPAWSEPYTVNFPIATSCQEMAENNHDPAHFRFVHGTEDIPADDVSIEGTYKKVSSFDGAFVRESFGLGLGVLRMAGSVTFFSSTTPIDEEHVDVRWTFLTPRSEGEEASRLAAENFLSGLSQDLPIWENKAYLDRPVLLKEERGIVEHRDWCQQFYSDPAREIP